MGLKNKKLASYGFLGVGALLLLYYILSDSPYKPYIGIVGFVVIMLGLYLLSQRVGEKPTIDTFVTSGEIEESEENELEEDKEGR